MPMGTGDHDAVSVRELRAIPGGDPPGGRCRAMTAGWLLVPVLVGLLVVTALHARRRVTHPFTKAEVDAARAQSRLLSRTSRDGVGGENVAPWMPGFP